MSKILSIAEQIASIIEHNFTKSKQVVLNKDNKVLSSDLKSGYVSDWRI